MNHKRVVLDTNVVISALVFGGQAGYLVEKLIEANWDLVVCEQLFHEVAHKLRDKFQADEQVISDLQFWLGQESWYEPSECQGISSDPADDYLFGLAESAQADFLVSGDKKHVLKVKSRAGTQVVSISQMIKILEP